MGNTVIEHDLLDACKSGDAIGFREIIESNSVDLNFQDENGWTALMYASVKDGLYESYIFNRLIQENVNLELSDSDGYTALIKAVDNRNHDYVETLISRGVNINHKTNTGATAFDYAVQWNYVPIMYLLKPSILNEKDGEGCNLLWRACQNLNEDHILFLAEKGADFFVENNRGESAFSYFKQFDYDSPKLQALKEKMLLKQEITEDTENSLSL